VDEVCVVDVSIAAVDEVREEVWVSVVACVVETVAVFCGDTST